MVKDLAELEIWDGSGTGLGRDGSKIETSEMYSWLLAQRCANFAELECGCGHCVVNGEGIGFLTLTAAERWNFPHISMASLSFEVLQP